MLVEARVLDSIIGGVSSAVVKDKELTPNELLFSSSILKMEN
jgi:hypothetical protein